MNRLNLIGLILLSVLLSQCVSDVNLSISGAESRIFIYSEFEPNSQIALRYSTATGLADKLAPINPTLLSEFALSFEEEGVVVNPAFRYNATTELFESPAVSFSASNGNFYSIKTSLNDFPQLKEISATTYIPNPLPLTDLEILKLEKTGDEFGVLLDMTVRFATNVDHPYYELVAYVIDPNDYLDPIKEIELDLVSNFPGVLSIPHRTSLLIDSNRSKGQYVDARIRTSISSSILNTSDKILFKLKTIGKDHYNYHENVAKRLESMNAPISEPVISYTNIENGLGLFSGYSSITDSLSIN